MAEASEPAVLQLSAAAAFTLELRRPDRDPEVIAVAAGETARVVP